MAPTLSQPLPVKFEWQFQEQNGDWITFGQDRVNQIGGDFTDPSTTSEYIEKYRISHRKEKTLFIRNQGQRLQLDFKSMTQTHLKSFVTNSIRRVKIKTQRKCPTLSQIKKPKSGYTSNIKMKKEIISSPEFEWYFMDEMDLWIKFGQPNTLEKLSCITNVTSDDIEKHYQAHPTQSMEIESQRHKYLLNFNTMTQTNKETCVRRRILRKSKATLDVIETSHYKRQSSNTVDSVSASPVAAVVGFSGKSASQTKKSRKHPPHVQPSGTEVLPSHWSPMPESVPWTMVQIEPPISEYIKHFSAIKKVLPNCNIKTMYRVQNRYLWNAYTLRKNFLETRYPGNAFREEFLYHGTDPRNVDGICEENIDWRLHGSKHGQRFGRGSYFSNSSKIID